MNKSKDKGMILKDRKVERYMLRFRGNKEKRNIYLHVISKKNKNYFLKSKRIRNIFN